MGRYHRTVREQARLVLHDSPGALERAEAAFAAYYNQRRYHEGVGSLTPAVVDVRWRRPER